MILIKTKSDLRLFLQEDMKVNNITKKNYLLRLLFRAENACVVSYLRSLRHEEYHYNNMQGSFYHRLLYFYFKWRTARKAYKYNIGIGINTVGYGLRIAHSRGGVVLNASHIGNYVIVNTGVLTGYKGSHECRPEIGDNVELGAGCKVIGKVHIGNNSMVAPNAVVVNDVPDNAIVGGIPAKTIKYKEV